MREILFKGKPVNDGRWLLGGLNDYGDYKRKNLCVDCDNSGCFLWVKK